MEYAQLPSSKSCPAIKSDDAASGAAGEAQTSLLPSLKIVHVLRSPVGGLFRHVLDVAQGQAERGHRVGLIIDSRTGGERAEAMLARTAPYLALGCTRLPMTREISVTDFRALQQVSNRVQTLVPDVLHGHGAKGGAFSRLALLPPQAIRVYTPHGGSLAHFSGTLPGTVYQALEWFLKWRTDLFLFESRYIAEVFRSKIGLITATTRTLHNGVGPAEFAPVTMRADATDLIFLGELRFLKGIDVLIDALAILKRSQRMLSLTVAGEGPDDVKIRTQIQKVGLAKIVKFVGHIPARDAFAMGRLLVFPSRSESLPYVVLEAAAAGINLVATRVGDIPEIFGEQARNLVPPGDSRALAAAIATTFDHPEQARRVAEAVRARVRNNFSLSAMIDGGLFAYRDAIAMRRLSSFDRSMRRPAPERTS